MDVNQDLEGEVPIQKAAKWGRTELVEMLIDHGADITSREQENGFTPLHSAVDQRNAETARLLLDRGADIQEKTLNGNSPLHVAFSERNDLKFMMDVIDLLLERGADLQAKNNDNETPVDVLIRMKDFRMQGNRCRNVFCENGDNEAEDFEQIVLEKLSLYQVHQTN